MNEKVWIGNVSYENQQELIEVCLNYEIIGYITNEHDEWEQIQNGDNPIEDHWEDGFGNVVSANGWGEYEKE